MIELSKFAKHSWNGSIGCLPRRRCRARLQLLADQGHLLLPRTEGIYELRAKANRIQYRMLYFFHGREAVVISHGMIKQQALVPPIEIERAVKRKRAFEAGPQRHTHRDFMSQRRRTTSDGLEILDRRYFHGRPARLRALADAQLNAQIAQEIYELRTGAGLTQKQLAELVGTTDSAISRLEDADYAGHSLKMLQRISTALNRRLEIHFVPIRARKKIPAR